MSDVSENKLIGITEPDLAIEIHSWSSKASNSDFKRIEFQIAVFVVGYDLFNLL